MSKYSHLPLNVPCKDTATDETGILTHAQIQGDKSCVYLFRPSRLTAKTKVPVSAVYLTSDRLHELEGKPLKAVETDLPIEVLGTEVTATNTGFTGTAVAIVLHINGCCHINVQAKGTTEKGEQIPVQNFDIRELTGVAIKPLSSDELEESKKKTPSPAGMPKEKKRRNREFGV